MDTSMVIYYLFVWYFYDYGSGFSISVVIGS